MGRIPEIRLYAEHGALVARDGLSICFYMRRSHVEIARAVIRSLETYVRAVDPHALGWYVDLNGDWQELDANGWAQLWRELHERSGLIVELSDNPGGASQYEFKYYGKSLHPPSFINGPDAVCALSFWLPSEYLEKHGPTHVRELALELAAPLPFNSGHAGLAVNALMRLDGVSAQLRPWCLRYPGLDIQLLEHIAEDIGTRVRAAHWLTFLGQPVLGELGGAAGLRSRLSSPGISIQEMEGERAVLTLGEWPETGDTEQGQQFPLYRELARVLEPWCHHERYRWHEFSEEEMRRWVHRFLD
ncbi:DUF3396 domain-containing protein [Archangium violaceum]|uniref:type VI immunity family protein n=1 Tax=Archangium violaceum TaxID=83451 RepID=UPI002B2EC870|nr:DUF3396 domain-containing protein [Archangium gephyra]